MSDKNDWYGKVKVEDQVPYRVLKKGGKPKIKTAFSIIIILLLYITYIIIIINISIMNIQLMKNVVF